MVYLCAGLLLFFGVHSTAIVALRWRDRVVLRLGAATWRAIYSLVSLAGLWLIGHGFGLAQQAPTVWYTPAAWLHSVTRLLMLPVFPLRLVPGAPAAKWNDLIVIVAGLALYLLFAGWAHLRLFGVSPLS